jgi:hypothetical protein
MARITLQTSNDLKNTVEHMYIYTHQTSDAAIGSPGYFFYKIEKCYDVRHPQLLKKFDKIVSS